MRQTPAKPAKQTTHTFHPNLNTRASTLGRCAENLVIWFLKNKNWRIIARNYASNDGEIDIIAQKKGADIDDIDTIIFVEVKSRSNPRSLAPEIRVSEKKRRRIIAASLFYMSAHPKYKVVYHYDIASVTLTRGHPPSIHYLSNAFCAKDPFGW